MNTQYTAWLRSLAAAQKGPVALPTAVRQLPYRAVLAINADFSGATIVAQVKSSPGSPTSLADFTVSVSSFSGGVTIVSLSLAAGTGADSTGSLPADADMDGIEYFPFDILVTPDGIDEPERLCGGLLPVSGFITLPA